MNPLCVVVAAALVAGGCGGDDGDNQLEVFAASSLTEAFSTLDGPRYTFAGSDTLATQIREGAEADVFASASPKPTQELLSEGVVSASRVFATNRLVIVVPRANEAHIRTLEDLRPEGVKVVMGDEGVPIGDYTRQALSAAHAEDVLDNVVSLEDDVKGVIAKVAIGEADAGFVYATDARAAADELSVIELPADVLPDVRYTVAVVVASARRDAAEDFVERLLSDEGRQALRDAGFGEP
jgi:molybdate transport system substrate-binding protein